MDNAEENHSTPENITQEAQEGGETLQTQSQEAKPKAVRKRASRKRKTEPTHGGGSEKILEGSRGHGHEQESFLASEAPSEISDGHGAASMVHAILPEKRSTEEKDISKIIEEALTTHFSKRDELLKIAEDVYTKKELERIRRKNEKLKQELKQAKKVSLPSLSMNHFQSRPAIQPVTPPKSDSERRKLEKDIADFKEKQSKKQKMKHESPPLKIDLFTGKAKEVFDVNSFYGKTKV